MPRILFLLVIAYGIFRFMNYRNSVRKSQNQSHNYAPKEDEYVDYIEINDDSTEKNDDNSDS